MDLKECDQRDVAAGDQHIGSLTPAWITASKQQVTAAAQPAPKRQRTQAASSSFVLFDTAELPEHQSVEDQTSSPSADVESGPWPDYSDMIEQYDKHIWPGKYLLNGSVGFDNPQQINAIREMVLVQTKPQLAPIARVALRYFHTPASSAAIERVWSGVTLTMTPARRAASVHNIAAAINLRCNGEMLLTLFKEQGMPSQARLPPVDNNE